MMKWRDIDTCPKHTKAVFGFMNQFGNWVFEVYPSSMVPLAYGYTHWLEIVPPVSVHGAR